MRVQFTGLVVALMLAMAAGAAEGEKTAAFSVKAILVDESALNRAHDLV